ncbi:hypothetical protein VP395_04380 [Mariniflexile soesokkakense]|uniref:YD repeat-containing protein n=1 Tax=Mariniflexile soesokkakense TaxID=1343160 RepID=A0ABV0A9T0_9FLAO
MHNKKFIILLLLFSACKNYKHFYNPEAIKSDAKRIESISYSFVIDDTTNTFSPSVKSEELFDKKRRIVKTLIFDTKGNCNLWIDFKYSKKGTLIKKTCFNKDSSINNFSSYEYEKNTMRLKKYTKQKKETTYFLNEYDKKRNSLEIRQIYNDSSVINSIISFDKKGRIIEIKRYKNPNQLSSITNNTYDINGNLIEKSNRNISKKILYLNTYSYDTNDNQISVKSHKIKDNDTTLRFIKEIENTYNKKQKLVKSTMKTTQKATTYVDEWSYFY